MKDLKAVKMYQIRRKRDLYNRSVKSNEEAISLKIEVRVRPQIVPCDQYG